jgi:hypothetical protein
VGGVFISYRQDDARAWGTLLRDALANTFGDERVFFAADTLGPGRWRDQIEAALRESRAVLVLIGARWLSTADARGERRLWKPDDVHRQEIELALASPAAVIPVLVDDAAMPPKNELPTSISALAELQARRFSNIHAHRVADLETLIGDLEKAGLVRKAPAESGSRWPSPVRVVLTGLKLLLITCVATIVLLVAVRVGLGWTFPPQQISALTLAIFIGLIAVSRVQARFRRGAPYAKD